MSNKITIGLSNTIVNKSRELVHGVRYISSVNATKLISAMISMVHEKDKEFLEYSLTARELSYIIGVRVRKVDFKNLQEELIRASLFIKNNESQEYQAISIFDNISYRFDGSLIRLRFSESMKPYLIDFNKNYLGYGIANIMALKSSYLIRLYEICKDKLTNRPSQFQVSNVYFELPIQKMRDLMMIKDSYQYSSHIKKNILEKAVVQFKKHTDIEIKFSEKKEGRKVVSVFISVFRNEKTDRKFSPALSFKKVLLESISPYYKKVEEWEYPTYHMIGGYIIFKGKNGKPLLADENYRIFTPSEAIEEWEHIYKNREVLFDKEWLDSNKNEWC